MNDHFLSLDTRGIQQALATHALERDAWLSATRTALEHEPHVDAAWLFGSLGRGDADALSDVDLFISVADQHFETLVEQRYACMAQTQHPLLVLEAPQNWPLGGVYAMAVYEGTYGPHQVDWYWVRHSVAQIPTQTQVLFDRSGLPRLDRPTLFTYAPVPERSAEEIARQTLNMFWVMWLITAKYVARKPNDPHQELFRWVALHLHNTAAFADIPHDAPIEHALLRSPADTLQHLRTLKHVMETVMPHVAAKGVSVPTQVLPDAERYLDLIEASILHGVALPATPWAA